MDRKQLIKRIDDGFKIASVVALLGPRQSGKTTLARQFASSSGLPFNEALNYFDLERRCVCGAENLVLYGDGDGVVVTTQDRPVRFLLPVPVPK